MKTFKLILINILFLSFAFNSFAGGFIIVSPTGSGTFINSGVNPYSLEVRYLKVDVKINGLIAVTTVEEVFYNPTNRNLEGWFMFPVPKYSAMKNFSMEINGKQTPAELLDSDKARKIYEDIVRKMKDPALLEYSDKGMYKVRIFPIEAKKEKKIVFTYTEVLTIDNGLMEYFFPLNTEKFSAKPLKNVSFRVDINSENKISTLYSPTHKTDVNRRSSTNAIVGFEQENIKPDIDFKLFIGQTSEETGLSIVSFRKNTHSDGFFLLNISPVYIDKFYKILPKDIVFVIDISGSMEGDKMEKAKSALKYCISNLNDKDKFNIVKFSTVATKLFDKKIIASPKNKDKALEYVTQFSPVGGTNMQEAFEIAFDDDSDDNNTSTIIFITDGKPTIGETENAKLLDEISKSNKRKSRIFTFGIGDDLNTHLLDNITENSHAYRSYITKSDDIEKKITSFFDKVNNPVFTGLNLDIQGNVSEYEVFPRKLPDLYKGSSITVLGRFKNEGNGVVVVKGNVGGILKTFKYKVDFKAKTENDFISVLWATRKVGFLLDQVRLNGENEELISEIKTLSKEYGIVTPYTSFLIIEDEEININSGNTPAENSIFSDVVKSKAGKDMQQRNKAEYSDIYNTSGFGSVRASKELQNMNSAEQVFDSRQGIERMIYKNEQGQDGNYSEQVKNVGGRAFYQNTHKWTDVYFAKNTKPVSEIQFCSDKYFELLNKEPKISKFLSLGKNIEFVYKGEQYKIYE